MMTRAAPVALALFLAQSPASAQDLLHAAEEAATAGRAAAGTVGALLGGATGAATGAVGRILGFYDGPLSRADVRERGPASHDDDGEARVEAASRHARMRLDDGFGVRGARGCRRMVARDRVLVIEPRSGRIVDILD